MNGNIELGDFIHQVKKELIDAQDKGDPFYALDSVQLEVSFVLEASGKAKGKLLVVSAEGEFKGAQTHKVTLQLSPLTKVEKSEPIESENDESPVSGGRGGIIGGFEGRICYDQDRTKDFL